MFKSLWLKNFRNFDEAVISFSPKVNIFIGKNGQGKTNLIEALMLLTQGESFRYSENINFIKHGHQNAFLKTKIQHADLDYDLQLEILKSRKHHNLNSKRTTLSTLIQKFPCVIFSPESLSAIKEGADFRRQLIDELTTRLNPSMADVLAEFRKTLRTRNKVLKNHLEGVSTTHETEQLLDSIGPGFINLATKISFARAQSIRSIARDFNEIMGSISGNKNVEISVEFVSSSQNILDWDEEKMRFLLQNRQMELRSAELSSGLSLVGPHKQDITFLYNGNNSRFYCSQGQQRALILSFKMAQIVYHRRVHGAYPVLLLDDVLSELDLDKREALLSFLGKIDSQIFITTTDLSLPSDLNSKDCSVIGVSEGRVVSEGM